MELNTFPVTRYELQFLVTEPILLPEYSGSALRGAFGRALRKISCMTKQADCKACPLYQTCPYTNIFEMPAPKEHHLQKFSQVPNGYIIEPTQWGEKSYQKGKVLSFNLVLFGRLIQQFPLIAFAFKRALEYNLAGGKANLININYLSEKGDIYSIFDDGKILDHPQEITIPEYFGKNLKLFISTPLRIQENGTPLSADKLKLDRFLITLLKRTALLSEFHYQKLDFDFESLIQQIEQIQDAKKLEWLDWTRYSSRQKQKMKLGGVVGEWVLKDVPYEWAKLLYLGQWLHCGKNATFGLGKYQITNL